MQRRKRLALLFCVVALWSAAPKGSAAEQRFEAPLSTYVGMLRTIDVEINGRPARMLFDTGAGVSSVTPEFASMIGCRPFGQISAHRMDGERVSFQRCGRVALTIAGRRFARELVVFDISSLLPAELPEVDGVLGLDVFDGMTVTLAPELRGLSLRRQRARERGTEGRMRHAREAGGAGLSVFVAASTAEGHVWLLLDSANLGSVRLHPSTYESLASQNSAPGSSDRLSLLVAGALPEQTAPEVLSSLLYDGALNAGYISQYQVTLDLGAERIWWRRAD